MEKEKKRKQTRVMIKEAADVDIIEAIKIKKKGNTDFLFFVGK